MRVRSAIGALIPTYVLASVIACALVTPSLADPTAPAQQSDCEIRANRYAAQHPHADPFDFMKAGFFSFFGKAVPPRSPFAYRDPGTGIIIYVESDGRHLAALDPRGQPLWVRNPFVDARMCPYRSSHPYIYWIGPPEADSEGQHGGTFGPADDAKMNAWLVKELRNEMAYRPHLKRPGDDARFVGLSFNSSQFGYVNIANGDFYEIGQN
jgi:hypothetical protein